MSQRASGNWRVAPVAYDDPLLIRIFLGGPSLYPVWIEMTPPPPPPHPPPHKKKKTGRKKDRKDEEKMKNDLLYVNQILGVLNGH